MVLEPDDNARRIAGSADEVGDGLGQFEGAAGELTSVEGMPSIEA